jgi:hypothetical protein
VCAELPRPAVDDVTGGATELRSGSARVSPSAMEADVVGVGLVGHGRHAGGGLGPHLALVESPSGKDARESWAPVSTASTYDWSLPSSTLRRSRPSSPSGRGGR